MNSLHTFRLELLGGALIRGPDGVPLTGRPVQRHRLALLALLALAPPPGRRLSRDKVIAYLWPEAGAEQGRNLMNVTVYVLRTALGEDALLSSGDDLSLHPAVIRSDVLEFEAALDREKPGDAVALYAGSFLDGFFLSEAAEFERWVETQRDRLRLAYRKALEQLAEEAERRHDRAAAVEWWRRLCTDDPCNSRLALRLMSALAAAGDRAGAIRHAQSHAELLAAELGAEPDPDVTALAERLRREPPAAPTPPTAHPTPLAAAPAAAISGERRARRYPSLVAALLVVLAGFGVYGLRKAQLGASSPPERSVGVLPFVNLSPDPRNTYFSDGLSEEIIAALSRIEGLRVAARTSSFALRDRSLHVRAIGDTLGVAAVLEGSVRRDGNRLRVTAQLIDAESGYHLWSQEYNRELQDVFVVQEDIARAIARALELQLADESAGPRRHRRPSLEAYDLYLRGLHLRNSLRADALRQANVLLDRAIALEPDFALAYAAKASIVAPQIYFSYVPYAEGVRDLRALTSRALVLDPKLGEAHVALGIQRLFFEWDWAGAEQALRRAIELNPSDAHAYHHLGNYMDAMGRLDEQTAARERSAGLDPLNARTRYVLARSYAFRGDYERAITEFRRAQQLDPVNPLLLGLGPSAPASVAEVFLRQGRHAEAVEEYLEVAALRDATRAEIEAMRAAFTTSGLPGFWRAWLAMDLRQSGSTPNPLRRAVLWAMVDDTTQAVEWLERAYRERNPGLIYLRREPALERLRSHARVARIIRQMRLPVPKR